jgi:hypothetical protein
MNEELLTPCEWERYIEYRKRTMILIEERVRANFDAKKLKQTKNQVLNFIEEKINVKYASA